MKIAIVENIETCLDCPFCHTLEGDELQMLGYEDNEIVNQCEQMYFTEDGEPVDAIEIENPKVIPTWCKLSDMQ